VVLPKINRFINLEAIWVDSCWGHKYIKQSTRVMLSGLNFIEKTFDFCAKLVEFIWIWVKKYCTNHETNLIVKSRLSVHDSLYDYYKWCPIRGSFYATFQYYWSWIDSSLIVILCCLWLEPCFLQRLFVQAFADWRFWCRQVMSSPQVCCKFWASVVFIIVYIFPFLFLN